MKWFKHPVNASRELPVRRIRTEYGYQGVGIFWCIVERVVQENGMISLDDLVCEFGGKHFNNGKVRSLVCDCGFFTLSEEGNLVNLAEQRPSKGQAKAETVRANLLNTLDKEERYKKDSSIEALISASASDSELNFYLRMKAEYPRVCQMQQPLTYTEMQRLLTDHPKERIQNALNDMENYPNLLTKYLSANRTLRKWIK